MATALNGRRVAILAADGVERVELEQPRRALEDAGARTDLLSIHDGEIAARNHDLEDAGTFGVDRLVGAASIDEYDALLLPGGTVNPDQLRMNPTAVGFVRDFVDSGKPVASICHGPWNLVEADRARGRRLTSWPGIRDDLVNAGAIWLDEPVVVDDNLLTSRGPQDIVPFVRALISHLGGQPGASANAMLSSPQRDQPPSIIVNALRWLPRPSLRGALTALVVGLGLGAIRFRRVAPAHT